MAPVHHYCIGYWINQAGLISRWAEGDFYIAVAVLSGDVRQDIKVFWFFFSKKNCFLALPTPLTMPRTPVSAQKYIGSPPRTPRDFIRRGLFDQPEGQLVR